MCPNSRAGPVRTAPGVRCSPPAPSARPSASRNRGAGVRRRQKFNWSTAKSAKAGRWQEGPDQGGEEGRHAERDRAADQLGQLRQRAEHLPQDVRHQDHQLQPERHERSGDPGDQDLEGSLVRTGRRRRRWAVRVRRRQPGAVRALQGHDLEEHPEEPEGQERQLLPGLRRIHLVRLQHEPARDHAVPDHLVGAEEVPVSQRRRPQRQPAVGQRGAVRVSGPRVSTTAAPPRTSRPAWTSSRRS